MFDSSQIINDWYSVCKKKEKLNHCIGTGVVQKCFDIKNISTMPFLNSTDAAKVIIADFLKIDYVCQKIFNCKFLSIIFDKIRYSFLVTETDAHCFGEKLPKSIDKICKRDYSSCNAINTFSSCIKKLAYKKCRKYVACFVAKTSTLEKCSYSSCGGCDSISASTSPIKNLCNDDN